jgi:thiamine transport system substrate-binding protein
MRCRNRAYRLALIVPLVLLRLLPAFGADLPELTLMTHDSFALGQELIKAFELDNGLRLRILKSGDAGAALNQAILSRGNPMADLFYGVDNTFLGRALAADIFEAYTPPALERIPPGLQLDPGHRLVPVNYGDVCLNVDLDWFSRRGLPPPGDLPDLLKPEYKGLAVVQNPATSSPGMAFLLATVGRFGEGGYLDFWRALSANDLYVAGGWSEAYFGKFTRAKGGTRPIVVSYASSPAAEVHFGQGAPDRAPTAALAAPRSAFRQIEFAGVLKGSRRPDLARRFIDFLLSPRVQADIPLQMWVYPADPAVTLPELFRRFARQAENPVELAPETIAAGRERWLNAWTDAVLR